jgi:hypothetical protein
MNPPFVGTNASLSGARSYSSEGRVYSGRIVLVEQFALKLDDVSDQQFSILIGDSDEATMESIGVGWVDDGINTQHFKGGFKEHPARKEQGASESFVHLEDLVECEADAAAADVDGAREERSLRCVAFRLKTDG